MNQLAKPTNAYRLYTGLFALMMLTGCSGSPHQRDASWKLVPITDVNMVVGEWEGTVKKEHATLSEGSVRLMIRDNSTYLFAGQTASRSVVGSGPLEARDGRLIGETERRSVKLALYEHKGKSVIVAESMNHETGERYRGEFTKIDGSGSSH
jgi:hypothetical protein